jgi:hypothetical protein
MKGRAGRGRWRWTRAGLRTLRRVGAALAVLVLAASIVAWIAGVRRADALSYRWGQFRAVAPSPGSNFSWSFDAESMGVTNARGRVLLWRETYTSYGTSKDELAPWAESWHGWRHDSLRPAPVNQTSSPGTYWRARDDFGVLGFRFYPAAKGGTVSQVIEMPLWMLTATAAGASAVLVMAEVRRWRQRRQPWQCPACGYDRRGLEAGSLCPECNTPG